MKIKDYLLSCNQVYHITFNPKGPGVCRIHLIPPSKPSLSVSWVVLINGYDILPISAGWAILLKEFIETVNKSEKNEFNEDDISLLISKTVTSVKQIFTKTSTITLRDDLEDIIGVITDLANGEKPALEIAHCTIKQYAKYMKAPHRMDLMISSMMKNNMWNCNQKCLHCYANTQENAIVDEIDTQSWKTIIDKLKEACVAQLTFTGGEPTLRNDLVELVEYSKYFITRLNTNGVELTYPLCKKLYEASLDSVQVTLYSSIKEKHNLLVGSDKFDKTVEGIKNAIKADLNVSINTPLCQINKDYVKTIEFARRLGVRYFSCSGIIMTGSAANESSLNTHLSKEELLEILKEACDYCNRHNLEISFTSPGWINETDLKHLKLVVPSCGACMSNMAVAPNGEVIPCQSWLSDGSLGNLLTTPWNKIYKSKKCKQIKLQSVTRKNHCPLAIKEVR